MVISSSSTNTAISTLNVLLLTLNKALLGGRPRIARVSLMVRVKFSLNKFSSSLVLKTSRAIISFSPFCLNTAPGTSTSVGEILQVHQCPTYSKSPTKLSHNIIRTNMTRDKAKTPNSVSHLMVWLNHRYLDPYLLQKRWFVHPLPLNSL